MKKLLFTALAVVAFSSFSMAKDNITKKKSVVIKQSKVVLQASPCEEQAIDSYEYILEHYEVTNESALLNYLIGRCHPEYR